MGFSYRQADEKGVLSNGELAAVKYMREIGYWSPPKYPTFKSPKKKTKCDKKLELADEKEKHFKEVSPLVDEKGEHLVEKRQVDEHGIFPNGRLATVKYLRENGYWPLSKCLSLKKSKWRKKPLNNSRKERRRKNPVVSTEKHFKEVSPVVDEKGEHSEVQTFEEL